MTQVTIQPPLEMWGIKSDFNLYLQLEPYSEKIIFIYPTISSFFDKLTNFRFVHNEILVSSEKKPSFMKGLIVDEISSQKFQLFKSYSLDFQIKFDEKVFKFKTLSPEFAIIWILQTLNSLTVGVALAILEFCNLEVLNRHENLFTSPNTLRLLLELGHTSLNRYDLIWDIIEKNAFVKELSDFILFLDRNIRWERKYDKIL